jgi:methylated-DNA-[protein]-cysteine S-methyltransferase
MEFTIIKKTKEMYYYNFDSPIGELLLAGKKQLEYLHFPLGKTRKEPEPFWAYNEHLFSDTIFQLDAYFSGKLKTFALGFNLIGTKFQKTVWRELLNIPYGETVHYGELATRIGNPKACRAVGMANSKNPIPVIIPCHRVIGKNGSLTGFGGGIKIKKDLLDLEYKNR